LYGFFKTAQPKTAQPEVKALPVRADEERFCHCKMIFYGVSCAGLFDNENRNVRLLHDIMADAAEHQLF